MKDSRLYSGEDLRDSEAVEAGRKASELIPGYGVSTASIYAWKSRFAGQEVSELKRPGVLQKENRRLKTLVADLSLDEVALRAMFGKKAQAGTSSSSHHRV